MKIRRSIFWFIAIVVMIALVLWVGNKKPVTGVPPTGNTSAPQSIPNVPPAATTTIQSNPSAAPIVASPPPPQNVTNDMKKDLAILNDAPIVFYGRLVDQFSSAIEGAQIAANVRIYNDLRSTVLHLTTTSDANGMFQINGGKGESLGIMPKKKGYILADANTYFKYSYMYPDHFSPDQNNPTVIKMWKLQGVEPLVNIDKNYQIPYTQAPINFDLVTGEVVPVGGDLKITVTRSRGIISEQNPQDWSVLVKSVDGGLIETTVNDARNTYGAPQEGYESEATFNMSSNMQSWHAAFDQMFFVESRGGKIFSKIRVIFSINRTPDDSMNITFSGVANTNGSPNWEATSPKEN